MVGRLDEEVRPENWQVVRRMVPVMLPRAAQLARFLLFNYI
jgi:hypothetical protein